MRRLIVASGLLCWGLASPAAPPAPVAAPPDPAMQALLDHARLWLLRERPDLARGVLQKALALRGDHARALLLLGEIELRSGRRDAGLAELTRLQTAHPGSPELAELQTLAAVYRNDAIALARLRQLDRSGRHAEAAAAARALFPDGRVPGLLAAELGPLIAASGAQAWEPALRRAEERAARDADPLNRLALAQIRAQRPATRKRGIAEIHHLRERGLLPAELVDAAWRRSIALQPAGTETGPLWAQYHAARATPPAAGDAPFARVEPAASAPPPAFALRPRPAPGAPAAAAATAMPSPPAEAAKVAAAAAARAPRVVAAAGPTSTKRTTPTRAAPRPVVGPPTAPMPAVAPEAPVRLASAAAPPQDDAPRVAGTDGTAGATANSTASATAGGVPNGAPEVASLTLPDAGPDAGQAHAAALEAEPTAAGASARRRAAGPAVAPAPADGAAAPIPPVDEAQAWQARGLALLRAGDHAAAAAAYDRASALDPAGAAAWAGVSRSAHYWAAVGRARAAAAAGDDATVFAELAPVLDEERSAIEGLLLRADALARRGDSAAALADYEAALQRRPGEARAWRGRLALALALAPDRAPALLDELEAEAQRLGEPAEDLIDSGALRRLAREQRAGGDVAAADALLERTLALAPAAAWIRFDLARQRLATQGPGAALSLMAEGLAAAPAQLDMRHAAVRIALACDDPDLARRWLEQAPRLAELPEQLDRTVRYEQALRAADQAIEGEDLPGAGQLLRRAEALEDGEPWSRLRLARAWLAVLDRNAARRWLDRLEPTRLDPPALIAWARLRAEAGAPEAGLAALERRLGSTEHPPVELLLASAGLQLDLNRAPAARVRLAQAVAAAPAGALDTRLPLLRLQRRAGLAGEARATLADLLARHPAAAELHLEAARMARAEDDDGAALARLDRVDQLAEPGGELRRQSLQMREAIAAAHQPVVATAFNVDRIEGRPGRSALEARTLSAALSWDRIGRGALALQLDAIALDAGALPADAAAQAELGSGGAPGAVPLAAPLAMREDGWAARLRWEGGGHTLEAGRVQFGLGRWIGGWRWQGGPALDGALADWGLALARRPVGGSLLAAAGQVDPQTGRAWGAVVADVLELDGATALGLHDRLSLDAQAGVWHGTGVARNPGARLRLAWQHEAPARDAQDWSWGAQLQWQRHAQDLSGYTLGHGGYYSPQRAITATLPLTLEGLRGRWSYALRAALSHSWTREDAAPWFPLDAALQAAAGDPRYAGDRGGGFGGSLRAAAEWRIEPSWALGARAGIERSSDYRADRIGVYLRHWLGPVPSPLDLPRPIAAILQP